MREQRLARQEWIVENASGVRVPSMRALPSLIIVAPRWAKRR